MNNLNSNNIILNAINAMAEGSGQRAAIANKVLAEYEGSDPVDCPKRAIYKAFLRNAAENNRESLKHLNTDVKFKPKFYDIAYHNYVQLLMDALCWKARRLAKARVSDADVALANNIDFSVTSSPLGNGLDFTEDAADEIGIDASNQRTIKADLMQCYLELTLVQAAIGQKMPYANDLDTLHLYAAQTVDSEGNWYVPVKINDYNEMMSHLDDVVQELQEQELAREINPSDANTISFDQLIEADRDPLDLLIEQEENDNDQPFAASK